LIAGIFYSILAALGDLAGGAIVLRNPPPGKRALGILTGFGAGFMLAVALVGMLPEALGTRGGMTAILIGYLIVHLTQHTLTPHFHFGEETHADAMVSRGIGMWALVGLLPHSFFDGVAISSGFLSSRTLGIFVFIGILLHKVPTGVSLASVMLASGNTRKRALLAVLAMGVATVLGGAVTPAITPLVHYGLPLAAGVTIYVAASNLIPESQREHDSLVQAAVFAGVLAFYAVQILLPHPI
jgi:ZIP family zinc transporter/zinc and cadmium transporter